MQTIVGAAACHPDAPYPPGIFERSLDGVNKLFLVYLFPQLWWLVTAVPLDGMNKLFLVYMSPDL